jgi:hypothetical protein
MGIDAAWHHVLASSIDDLSARGGLQIQSNLGDPAIHAVNVRTNALVRIHDGTTAD